MSVIQSLLSQLIKHTEAKYSVHRSFPLFSELSNLELKLLENILIERNYKPNELLFEETYPLEAVFLIIEGEVKLEGKLPGLRESGEIIGLVDMFKDQYRSSSARATRNTRVWAVSRTDLLNLIDKNPRLGTKILKAICRYLGSHINEASTTD